MSCQYSQYFHEYVGFFSHTICTVMYFLHLALKLQKIWHKASSIRSLWRRWSSSHADHLSSLALLPHKNNLSHLFISSMYCNYNNNNNNNLQVRLEVRIFRRFENPRKFGGDGAEQKKIDSRNNRYHHTDPHSCCRCSSFLSHLILPLLSCSFELRNFGFHKVQSFRECMHRRKIPGGKMPPVVRPDLSWQEFERDLQDLASWKMYLSNVISTGSKQDEMSRVLSNCPISWPRSAEKTTMPCSVIFIFLVQKSNVALDNIYFTS